MTASVTRQPVDGGVFSFGDATFLGPTTVCAPTTGCAGSIANGDTPDRHLSVFDARTGAHDRRFTAQANTPQGPQVALVGKDHLYVGGDFTDIEDRPVEAGGTGYKQPGFVQFPALPDGR